MTQRPLHSEYTKSYNRNFFFDIKQTEKGNAYLTINISEKKENEKEYTNNRIVIFENEMVRFGEAFMRAMINFRQTGREAIVEAAREKYPNAYAPWTKSDDKELAELFVKDTPIKDMAQHFGRAETSIKARLEKLELLKECVTA